MVLSLGCLGTPLIKSSSLLEKVCSVSLSNITFAIDSGCFRDHRIILCSAIQHHRIFLWFSSEHRIFLWFSSEHRIILWVFSSEHRIILCTEISSNHLAVFFYECFLVSTGLSYACFLVSTGLSYGCFLVSTGLSYAQ